jgi:F0F1-type ATP synthase alpha subunit
VREFESELHRFLKASYGELLAEVAKIGELSADGETRLKSALAEFKKSRDFSAVEGVKTA